MDTLPHTEVSVLTPFPNLSQASFLPHSFEVSSYLFDSRGPTSGSGGWDILIHAGAAPRHHGNSAGPTPKVPESSFPIHPWGLLLVCGPTLGRILSTVR